MVFSTISISHLTSFTLLAVLFAALTLASIAFLCGGNVGAWMFPVAIIAVLGGGLLAVPKEGKCKVAVTSLMSLLVIAASVMVASWLYDYSYDGQTYHQMAILNMMNGWNPFREACPQQIEPLNLWVDHYAKGIETLAAVIASTMGDVESGKAVYFIMSAAMLAVYDKLGDWLPNRKKSVRMGLAVLTAFPAVVVSQMFTFYLDWMLYFLFVLCLCSLHSIWQGKQQRMEYAQVAMLLVFAASMKFNFLFWLGMMLLAFGGLLIIGRRTAELRRGVAVCMVATMVGIVAFGFNPYLTNMLAGHHPLYPLMGSEAVDIMSGNTPEGLRHFNDVSKVLISLLSVPNNWRLQFAPPPCGFSRIRSF